MLRRRESSRTEGIGAHSVTLVLALLALMVGLLGAVSPASATAAPPAGTSGRPTVAAAQTGDVIVDPDWQPVGGLDGEIQMMARQPDGKIIIVGGFEAVGGTLRRGIARLNSDGTLDPTFDPGSGFGDAVHTYTPGSWAFVAVNVAADGRITVVGNFGSYNGVSRNGVVRIQPTGAIDPTFNPGTGFDNTRFDAALVQPDGKIVVAGSFTTYNGTSMAGGGSIFAVVRLLPSGALEKQFPNLVTYVGSLALAPDGKIVAGGGDPFSSISGAVGRWRADGTRDTGFTTGMGFSHVSGFAQVWSVAVQADGKVLVVGLFDEYNGAKANGIVRLNVNGTLDAGYDVGTGPTRSGGGSATATASAPGGVADGAAALAAERPQPRPTPTPSTTPRATPTATPRATELSTRVASPVSSTVSASVWPTPTSGGASLGMIYRITLQPDGRAIVQGEFDTFNAVPRKGIARLNGNGSVDAGFVVDPESLPFAQPGNPFTSSFPLAFILQADGKFLVGGQPSLFRLNSDGSVDSWTSVAVTSGTGSAGDVNSVAVQSDGKVLFAGDSWSFNGVDAGPFVRLNRDGTLDDGFGRVALGGETMGAPPEAEVVVPLAGGRVMIGGTFETVGGVTRRGIARLNSDGSLDPSFDPGAGPAVSDPYASGVSPGTISDILVQPDGRLLVSGYFVAFNGVARRGIARLNVDGSLDAGFDPGRAFTGLSIDSVALQPDGKVLVGGGVQVGDDLRFMLQRFSADGTVDPGFSVGAGFNGPVTALGLTSDGHVVAGGDFSAVNWTARNGIVRLNPNGSVDATFNPGAGFQVDEFSWGVTGLRGGGVRALQVTSDGSILVGGDFGRVDGVTQRALARLNPNGSRDVTFTLGSGFPDRDSWTGPGTTIASLAQQPDGTIVVGGSFHDFNGAFPAPWNITRLLPVVVPPGSPTGLSVTNGDGAALVSFSSPAGHGGAPVSNYEFSVDGGGWQAVSPASTISPVVIGGLTNGVTYRVRLRARNAAGGGVASAEVVARPVAARATSFVPVEPARVVDTRVESGGGGPLLAGTTRRLSVANRIGGGQVVPVGALAVAYNVTVPGPGTAGHVRVMPGDAVGLTSTSAINFRAGETIANAASVKIDANREVLVYAGATANVVLDVVGYYLPVATPAAAAAPAAAGPAVAGPAAVMPVAVGGRFTAVTPVRVYDSSLAAVGNLAAGATRAVGTASTQVGGVAVVPAGASAVAYNVTVVNTAGGGHLRVMPGNVATSSTSAINWTRAGEVIANASVVGVDAARRIRVYNGSGAPVRFLVDVVGYYSSSGQAFYPIDPVRTTETRWLHGGAGPVAPGLPGVRTASTATVPGTTFGVVPVGATAAGYNLTAVNTGGVGHARVYPADQSLVSASALNWPGAGYTRANASVVGISTGREVKVYNGSGAPTDVLIDINGYYK